MKRCALWVAAALLAACGGGGGSPSHAVSKEPVSVRGWIADVEGGQRSTNPDMETARRSQLFQATEVWVEDAQYVSGGVAPNGSFILLDVPPGNVTIGFHAPGAESAKLVLQNIPGNADVVVPGLILKKNGVGLLKPQDVKVRMAARVNTPAPTGQTSVVAGLRVPVMNVPINAMADRHDYPVPEGYRPVATFK